MAFLAAGDVIYFKDGRSLEGKILEEGDESVVIKTKFGKVTIEKSRIQKIEYKESPEEIYERLVKDTDMKDPDAVFKLALWCRDNGKKRDYSRYLEEVLKLDDQHDEANRELGNVQFDGVWYAAKDLEKAKRDKEERMKAQGMVKHNGEWMPEWEAKRLMGYVEYEGDWITRMEKYHKMGEKDIPEVFGYPMIITDSKHFTIRSKDGGEHHEELLDYCELEYEHFIRTFEPDYKEQEIISFFPIPIYILEDLDTSVKFVKSGYIKRYNPPKKEEDQFRPEHNFSIYFPRPLVVLTKGHHLRGASDPQVSQIGYMAHHIGHILIRRFKRGGRPPGWIESGVAHYYEGLTNFHQTLSVCDYRGFEDVEKWTSGWGTFLEWRKRLKDPSNHDRLPPVDHLFTLEIETMTTMEMAKAWSVCSYLLKHHRKAFVEYARRSWAPYRGEKKLPQAEAWKLAFGELSPLHIEKQWRAWIVDQPVQPPREDRLILEEGGLPGADK
jgi:hypothetical protein